MRQIFVSTGGGSGTLVRVHDDEMEIEEVMNIFLSLLRASILHGALPAVNDGYSGVILSPKTNLYCAIVVWKYDEPGYDGFDVWLDQDVDEMVARLKHHALVQRLIAAGSIHEPEKSLFDVRRKGEAN